MANALTPTNLNESGVAQFFKNFDPESAGPLTFFVGWKSGKSYHLRRMGLHIETEKAFRAIAKDLVQGTNSSIGLQDRDREPWTAEAEIFAETYLECSLEEVGEAPKLANRSDGEGLLGGLKAAEKLELMEASGLEKRRIELYGFAIGAPGKRTVFIRRSNPRRGLSKGRFFGYYPDVLRVVDAPTFMFDGRIDLVIVGDRLVVLSQAAFAMIFRDTAELRGLVSKWGDSLRDQIEIESTSLEYLKNKANRDSRQRQRLEAIVQRRHLEKLSPEDVKKAMEDNGMDTRRFFNDENKLSFSPDDVNEVLYFLNEDLYRGVLTGEQFRADKKATL